MKSSLRSSFLIILISSIGLWAATSAQAQSSRELEATSVPISGSVVSITGARMEIQLTNGQIQSVTARENLPQELVGRRVTGTIIKAGDSYLILNPQFSN